MRVRSSWVSLAPTNVEAGSIKASTF
jgi:hypothetical protein